MSIPCQAIEILSITHSQITKIPPIQRMRKLKTLILDSNNICEWDAFIFEMNSIEMLSIHSNKLKNIPSSIKLLKNLNILILYNNPIFTHKSKQYVQAFVSDLQATKIKKLNIATTDLHFFPNNLDELKSLAFVNLSNNPIKNISKQCFKHIVAISLEGTKVKYNKRLFNKLSPALP